MNIRPISIVAIVQLVGLGFALLSETSVARNTERFFEPPGLTLDVSTLNIFFRSAFHFRDYGWMCLFLVIAWVGLALHSEKSFSLKYSYGIFISGILLALGFFILTVTYGETAASIFQTN